MKLVHSFIGIVNTVVSPYPTGGNIPRLLVDTGNQTAMPHIFPICVCVCVCAPLLTWRIPWTEKPGRLQSIGSHRVRHNGSDLARTHA